jgi:hypothetical protein
LDWRRAGWPSEKMALGMNEIGLEFRDFWQKDRAIRKK